MSVATIATVPGVRPVVELGVGDTRIPVGQARWDVAHWDDDPDATWAGAEPTWLDVTCDVHDVEITLGRERSIERWQVGSATITVDNRTGWADLATAPTGPAVLTVRPGRAVRVGVAVDDDPVRWLWRGFVDAAEPRYDPILHDTVVLACVDAKGWVGKVDVARVDPPIGVETASARINRILDIVTWAVDARDIAPTSVALIATELGGKAADLIDIAADSAGGAVFGDARHGAVVFKPRDWQVFDDDTPPDGTIGNVAAGDVCPVGWELSFNLTDVATRTVVGRPSDPGRMFDDLTNQIIYGVETFTRTDLECSADDQLDILGQRYLVVLSADWMPRVDAVTLDAATSTPARNLCAGVDPTRPSRYRCRLVEGGRTVFDRQMFATGVQHRIDPHNWTCRVALDAAAPFAASVVTRWDTAGWDAALWTETTVALTGVF